MNDLSINTIKSQIDELASEGKAIVITDNESYAFAGEFLKKIKQAQKTVDDTRKSMTRPLDESKKKIMDLFRPVETRITEIEASIKTSLLQYQRIIDERIRKEREEQAKKDAEEMAQKIKDAEFFGEKEIDFEPSRLSEMPITVAPVVAGISKKKVWDYEIIDESKLSREYLSADLKKIRAAIDFGIREAQGLRIFEREIISARR